MLCTELCFSLHMYTWYLKIICQSAKVRGGKLILWDGKSQGTPPLVWNTVDWCSYWVYTLPSIKHCHYHGEHRFGKSWNAKGSGGWGGTGFIIMSSSKYSLFYLWGPLDQMFRCHMYDLCVDLVWNSPKHMIPWLALREKPGAGLP